MNKIIINADDCGYNAEVDKHIEAAIVGHHITSTTIMANLDDFDGAINLYNTYKDTVSFGFHLNLTEGHPLTYSQLLLDMGFFKEDELSNIIFNGNQYRRKILDNKTRKEIHKEITAQVTKILDSGVKLSHLDSHHFMHEAVFMIPLLPKFCNEIGITKVRNYRNYMPWSINRCIRESWSKIMKFKNSNLCFTDYFDSYQNFFNLKHSGKHYEGLGSTIELMTHPGGIYPDEESLYMNNDSEKLFNCQLINYNEI